jgi:hypothetical protein
MDLTHQYRIIIHVAEDRLWDAQDMQTGRLWNTQDEAQAEADRIGSFMDRYPEGSYVYIESRSWSDWSATPTDTNPLNPGGSMLEITLDMVKAAALNVIREVGKEYGYRDVVPGWWDEANGQGRDACQYTVGYGPDAKPACLVGRILFDLGVPLYAMRKTCGAGSLLSELHEDRVAHASVDAVDALFQAQTYQDRGRTWFYALVEARLIDPEEV